MAILFEQLLTDRIVNVQYKRCGLPKTRLIHPSLPFDSLPYPTRIICRRITWQPNKKRLTIFYEYGALSQAPEARVGARLYMTMMMMINIMIQPPNGIVW